MSNTIDRLTLKPPAMRTAPALKPSMGLAVYTLALRELVRFLRQRTRIVGALGQPIIFWVLFGAGLSGSFQGPAGISYQEYFFPGVAVMIVMFTAIFSTISIIEDRREGFLQGVLIAPVPRAALVLGKVCGGTVLAVLQAVLFLAVGPALALVGLSPQITTGLTWLNLPLVIAYLSLVAFSLTALGYVIAWPMDSTHGFHAIMSVFLMPMWLLSGSFFPAPSSGWLAWIIRLNPLTYGTSGLRRLITQNTDAVANLPSLGLSVSVTLISAAVYVAIAIWMTGRPSAFNAR
ncbi:ABC transporter permease [Schlesneria paludicola]|uniref:ABC transporter permease n=1 Tax=Schlesneria paludicola TaxID=360056 RepID=UPI00029A5B49|nr:ABC transporter permease [Schlesneria paludicola]